MHLIKWLTLYLLALICSTWNLLGQLHCETCRLTLKKGWSSGEWMSSVSGYIWTSNYPHALQNSHLLIDLVAVQCFPIGVSARVKSAHKLIVVNETVTVHVKDVCHRIHLQRVCGKFYTRGEGIWYDVMTAFLKPVNSPFQNACILRMCNEVENTSANISKNHSVKKIFVFSICAFFLSCSSFACSWVSQVNRKVQKTSHQLSENTSNWGM